MARPRGLGLWSAFLGAVEGGDFGKMAARIQEHGVGWIAIRSGGSHRAIAPASLAKWSKLARDSGAMLYTWNYSYPNAAAVEVEHIASLFAEGVDGHIIDAEIEWERAPAADSLARAFGHELRAKLGADVYLAHAPFAISSSHPGFPYDGFASFCDDVHPQAYWTEFGWSLASTSERFDRQVFAKLNACVAPVGVTYGKGSAFGRPPGELTAADVAAFCARYDGRTAFSFYSWEAAMPAFWEGLAQRHLQAGEPAPELVGPFDGPAEGGA